MKYRLLAGCIALALASGQVWAGQDVFETRMDAMGGTGVAAGNRISAAFVNPALMSLPDRQSEDVSLLLPALGAEVADDDDMIDKFDTLEDNYDALDAAIDRGDSAGILRYRDALVGDLESLRGNVAFANAGLGLNVVLPSSNNLSLALFSKTYLEGFAVANISDADILMLSTIDPTAPPALDNLTSQGRIVAGAVTDLGFALSTAFEINEMPVTVGIAPKYQRLDTFNYAVSANDFDVDDFDSDDYRNDNSGFNVDIGAAIQPMTGLTVGVSGRNLVKQELTTVMSQGQQLTYQVKPMVTAGVAYQYSGFTVSTDLDLTENQKFAELEGPKYWRMGGEYQPASWFAVRVGYRQDLNDVTPDIYSIGTGFTIGSAFSIDLTGMFGSDDALGGALQTSYYF